MGPIGLSGCQRLLSRRKAICFTASLLQRAASHLVFRFEVELLVELTCVRKARCGKCSDSDNSVFNAVSPKLAGHSAQSQGQRRHDGCVETG